MVTTNYIYDGFQLLGETDENNDVTRTYTNEPDDYTHPIGHTDVATGESSYYHYDGQGNTRAVTDEDENVTDTFTYDSWGNLLARTGMTNVPFQFGGEHGYYKDEELDTYYVMARVYDPSIIRWLSVDPIGQYLVAGMVNNYNPFLYCNNNPDTYIDRSGDLPEAVFEVAPPLIAPKPCDDNSNKCIEAAIRRIRDRIAKEPDCLAGLRCKNGARMSCDSDELTACILETLEPKNVRVECAKRGVGGCHAGKANLGQTDTACGTLKTLGAAGLLPLFPSPVAPHLVACTPCKYPLPFVNDCSRCPEPTAKPTIYLCIDQSPSGKSISSYCDPPESIDALADLLFHEASHNCVGGHLTTGGDQAMPLSCDVCGRPDSWNIQNTFESCK